MTQRLILKNPRITTIDGIVTYTPYILFPQIKRIIEKELLKRNIIVDMVEIKFNNINTRR